MDEFWPWLGVIGAPIHWERCCTVTVDATSSWLLGSWKIWQWLSNRRVVTRVLNSWIEIVSEVIFQDACSEYTTWPVTSDWVYSYDKKRGTSSSYNEKLQQKFCQEGRGAHQNPGKMFGKRGRNILPIFAHPKLQQFAVHQFQDSKRVQSPFCIAGKGFCFKYLCMVHCVLHMTPSMFKAVWVDGIDWLFGW